MLDRLISKLTLSGSDEHSQDGHHEHASQVEHRFETDVNVYPERASKPPRISPDISYYLSMHGEVRIFPAQHEHVLKMNHLHT